MDAIFKRASVRAYTDEPVSREQIEQLMRAAMAAPSACNQQPWEFFVTDNRETLAKLGDAVPYWRATKQAAWAIAPCMRRDGLPCGAFVQQDMGASVENILLEAAGLGLGALWMGVFPDQERIDIVSDAFDVPGEFTPYALIAVGHPAAEVVPGGPARYDESRVHWR